MTHRGWYAVKQNSNSNKSSTPDCQLHEPPSCGLFYILKYFIIIMWYFLYTFIFISNFDALITTIIFLVLLTFLNSSNGECTNKIKSFFRLYKRPYLPFFFLLEGFYPRYLRIKVITTNRYLSSPEIQKKRGVHETPTLPVIQMKFKN